jgi:hypothetical protein
MKRLILPLLVVAMSASTLFSADTAGVAPRVPRTMLVAMEKSVDGRVRQVSPDNPFTLLGPTRGIYLEGYGAVFTAEVNLVPAPPTMVLPGFGGSKTAKDEVEQLRKKKFARLPQLMQALRQSLIDSAASLDTVPPEQQIVVVALLSKYSGEDTTGLPQQIMMQASKKDLLEQRNNPGALDAAIRITEN